MKPKKGKKIAVLVISLLLAAACIGGGVYLIKNRSTDPVFVFQFMDIGMTEFWGDSKQCEGMVTSDNIQNIYPSDGQIVSQIKVKQGDKVNKGDVLVVFDTTMSDLNLEKQRLEVEKLKLQLKDEQKKLKEIQNMVPSDGSVDPDTGETIGSGYTASQISQMLRDQKKAISETEFAIKKSELSYKIAQTEVSDGKVTAKFNGTVSLAVSAEDARASGQPMISVSGGGGFYISCTIDEFGRDKLVPGSEVTIMDWNTGENIVGKIDSVGSYPASSENGYFGFYGGNNPNVSYYPFTVFVDGSANLMTGSYVSVEYSTQNEQSGIYLEDAFLRTEDGKSYVYVRGENGNLEKRYITTGKSIYGRYTEITSGLSESDWIAFPYGKNVKNGAKTTEGNLGDLYNY